MADKSIINIEIDSGAFDDFLRKVEKYKSDFQTVLGKWAELRVATDLQGASFEKLNKEITTQISALERLGKQQFGQGHAVDDVAFSWGTMTTHSSRFFQHIERAGLWLFKWASLTGVFGAILGAGGILTMSLCI